MDLYLHNTLSGRKEKFTPLNPGKVGMYVCGPTVYDRAHLGNARPVVVMDVLHRLLRRSFDVSYVRNITDIDDKIMNAAKASGRSIMEITTETTRHYHEDIGALNVLPPRHEPKATEYVPQMIAMIERLISRGHAYEAEGHVLFHVPSKPHYGCLSHRSRDEMIAGARVDVAPYKRDAADFVLWKPSLDDQPGWQSPWGYGRPGWHIECSAMSHALLGESFDIHAGGQDLIFPHHENEIAQSTGAFGEGTFARFWLHNGVLTINGEKMSKSLNNFLTITDVLHQANGDVVRYALLSGHYRHPLDWSESLITSSKAALDRLYTALEGFDGPVDDSDLDEEILRALHDDLNTPQALARLHALASEINKAEHKVALQRGLKASAALLGLLPQTSDAWFRGASGTSTLSADAIEAHIKARQEARARKDFAAADAIRTDLLDQGVELLDGAHGTTWRYRT
ncbi:MAG: cysteine--tRNA ligase [Holosporales bacterium]